MRQGNAWLVWMTVVVLALSGTCLAAQSGAITGQIGGLVSDPSGAPIAGAKVTATNVGTGAQRSATTDSSGVYSIPLLSLGSYKVSVEAQGFGKYDQTGIELSSGSSATIDVTLKVGAVVETVTVTGEASITEPSRMDIGATVNNRAVQNLPLISRNVYNFILLQPGISATPNTEFGVPRKINANGFNDRIDYQLDGGNNTESDRKGIRLMPISQTFVREIVEASNGFAPEFGNTTGTVFNAVTNSGTNDWHGSATYLFRTPGMTATPSRNAPTAKPSLKLRDPFFTVGGPIKKDKLHFFASYEKSNRALPSVITVTPANAALIGIPATDIGSAPFTQANQFLFGRTDWQINDKHRLMARYMYFRNDSPWNNSGGLKTISQSSTEFVDRAHAAGTQLVSTFSPTVINEFRFALGYRNEKQLPQANTPSGPFIVISGIASFGGPNDVSNAVVVEKSPEFVDNVSVVHGSHNFKFGGTIRPILDHNDASVFGQYNFSSVVNYLAAKNGTNLKSYSSFAQTLGNPSLSYTSIFYGFFAQDSWTVNSRLNLAYGLRYDLYKMPGALSTSTIPVNQNFKTDKNNFAPRFGAAYSLDQAHKTVVRFSASLFYDPPQTDFYKRAMLNNGSPQFFNATFLPADAGAPTFPNVVSAGPTPAQSINGLSPDFTNLYSFNTNLQVTRELSHAAALTVGYLHTKGTRLPVARNVNYTQVVSTLADGRPVFSTTAGKVYPQFGNVFVDESVGNSQYNALTVSLNKRFAHDFQMQVNYAWSHAIDDAPEENVLDSGAGFALSDTTNRRRDRASSPTDRRHILTLNGVWNPTFQVSNKACNYLLNNNQLGFFVNAASGDPYNIVGNQNLAGYAESPQLSRPLFYGRNTFRGQRIGAVDLRYSRSIPIYERLKGELLAEAGNVFNHTNTTSYNLSAAVFPIGSTAGVPGSINTAGLASNFLQSSGTRDPRYIQLGFKLIF